MRDTFSTNTNTNKTDTGLELNDSLYLRQLSARYYDFDKASNMLKETIKWRKDFGLDSLHGEAFKNSVAKENIYINGQVPFNLTSSHQRQKPRFYGQRG